MISPVAHAAPRYPAETVRSVSQLHPLTSHQTPSTLKLSNRTPVELLQTRPCFVAD